MTHVLRALPDLGRVAFAGVVAYRAEMAIWILSTLVPLIMLDVWTSVAATGPVAGMTETDIARYFAVNLLVRQVSSVWIAWEMNWDIRSGRLSMRLLKPMHPLLHSAIDTLVAIPFRVLVLLPILVALVIWKPELARLPTADQLGLFVVSMSLAWVVNYLFQALIAILAFWLDKTDAMMGVWFAVWSVLSGYVAPLAMFPAALQPLLTLLPFRGTLGVPVEILGGFLTPAQALPQIAIQAGWAVVLLLTVRWAWAKGLARYGAFGA